MNMGNKEDFNVVSYSDSKVFSITLGENIIDIGRLDWDSEILGLNLYRINKIELNSEKDYEIIKKFIDFIKLKFDGIDCITCKIESTKISLIGDLQKNGFILAGLPIKLFVNISNIIDYNDHNIRLFKKEDVNALSKLARNTFLNAYRYNDKNFDKDKVDDLYAEWIKNSCNGRADAVFVYEENDIPSGFIACNIKDNSGLIDLIAVSKDLRGKGIGTKLILNSLSWFKGKGLSKVKVSTEAMNYPSLSMYQKAGFNIEWIGFDLDYWFK